MILLDTDFIKQAHLADGKQTVYMWGTYGQLVTHELINYKMKQYPGWYTASKVAYLRSLVGRNVFAYDCIGLMKGITWQGKYASNGMPDVSANTYINMCNSVSSNFDNIVPGEVVWLRGHIGLYIGGDQRLVIEATPSWENGVQITRLSQRNWTKHGKMPHVTYSGKEIVSGGVSDTPMANNKLKITGKLDPETIGALQVHFGTYVDKKISPKSMMVKAMQVGLGVKLTQVWDEDTTRALQKYLALMVDGVISTPYSNTIAEIQRRLNAGTLGLKKAPVVVPPAPKKLSITGALDEPTIMAMQRHFKTKPVDGVISVPESYVIKEFQRWLNDVAF